MSYYLRAYHYLRCMMRRAFWPRDKIKEYQNKCLRKVIRHAYETVPYYHKRYRKMGIRPDDVKTVDDINKLPIIRRKDVRENIKDLISEHYKTKKLRILRTSGSTGQPLLIYISKEEDVYRKSKHLRANISCGQKPFDRWVVITSPHHFSETTKLQRLLGIYAPIPISVFESTSKQVSILSKVKPNILDGYSSSLVLLANELEKHGLETIRPKFIIGGAEIISDSSIRRIEEVFNAPFYDQYACVEVERIAWQCPEKVGYHLDADTVVVEFIDKNGEKVASGECGEIVCTSLFNFAMPLIRYAVGDLGRPSNDECSCGRKLPLMKIVEGRKDSIIILPDGSLLSPRAISTAVSTFKFYVYMEQFKIIQKRKDFFEVTVKMVDANIDKNVFERELIGHLTRTLNFPRDLVDFEVRFVDNIPLEKSGKLAMVVSEIAE